MSFKLAKMEKGLTELIEKYDKLINRFSDKQREAQSASTREHGLFILGELFAEKAAYKEIKSDLEKLLEGDG